MNPHEYCAEKVAQRGSSLFYAVFQLPREKRQAVVAIHAFRREVEDVALECSDPGLGAAKLEWWRRQLASVYDGVPQHPVARALQEAVATYELPESLFVPMIEGVESDFVRPRYPDFTTLEGYCERTGAAPHELSARVLGFTSPLTLERARALGIASRLSRLVRDIGLDARRNRIYLPADEMQRYGVAHADVLHRRHSDRFRQLAEHQIDRIQRMMSDALSGFPETDRKTQRPLIALAAIGQTLLQEIRADECRVLDRRIGLTPVRKLWIAWRAR